MDGRGDAVGGEDFSGAVVEAETFGGGEVGILLLRDELA